MAALVLHTLPPRAPSTDRQRRDRATDLDVLVRTWRLPLYAHALHILKDPDAAFDAVQEVFVRALREPRFFDPTFQRRAWLFRVTRNLCFNWVRNHRRRTALVPFADPPRAPVPDPLAHAEAREQAAQVAIALSALSPPAPRSLGAPLLPGSVLRRDRCSAPHRAWYRYESPFQSKRCARSSACGGGLTARGPPVARGG